jgi:hypothetical protein
MARYRWRSYQDAKKYVSKFGFSGQTEYRKWAKTEKRPKDIPLTSGTYKRQGVWRSWGDYLGTNIIATYKIKYRTFEKSRKFALKQNLKTKEEWMKFAKTNKLPSDIPRNPDSTYKRRKDSYGGQWKGWGDFLGTGNVAKKDYRSFEDARKFVHSLNLTGSNEWKEYSKSGKKPDDIPGHPYQKYRKEWKGMGDWVGSGYIAHAARKYCSYEDAQKFVQSKGCKSHKEWREYFSSHKLPDDIPRRVDHIYIKQGTWKGWGDFLGTGRIADMNKAKDWLSIKEAKIEARKIAKKLGIKNQKDWSNAYNAGKIPKNLPGNLYHYQRKQKREMKKYGY